MMGEIFSYETMPYPSKFFLQTHPDRLATIGTLFGIDQPKIENCRYLELGCGNGSNLISHGYNLSNAEFVGIDLGEIHINEGKKAVEELNLKNVKLFHGDVMEMTVEEYGKFDFIIAHGLFSWIPEFVREKVLSLYNEMLNENGIGYISYNAFPGAHLREMVRNMMRFHTSELEEPLEKVGSAISFLSLLSENAQEKKTIKPIFESELERHFRHDAADIYHDDLGEFYRPFYFHEFADLLKENDLQFLSEAEFHAMSINSFSPEVREMVAQIDDIVKREQYLDFFRGRVFRQTLFCRAGIELNRQIAPEILDKFFVSTSLRPASATAELASAKTEKFVGAKGVGIEINHPLTKTVLSYLGEIWGRSIAFPELLEMAKNLLETQGFAVEDFENQADTTRAILFQIFSGTDLIGLHKIQFKGNTEAGEKPKVNNLARWQIQNASNITTTLNLDLQIDDDVSRQLLELMDGTRNKQDLLKEMSEFIETNEEIEDKQELLNDLENWISDSIAQLAKLGTFEK